MAPALLTRWSWSHRYTDGLPTEKPEEPQKETGKEAPTRNEIQEALRALESDEIVIEEAGKFPMAMAFKMAPLVAEHLLQLNWCLCDAPSGKFFITSDTPLVIFAQEGSQAIFGGGLGLPHVEVSFPISPQVCLCLDRRHTQRRRRIAADVVDELNRRTVCMAERFVITPQKAKQIETVVVEFAHTRGRPKMDREEVIQTLRRQKVAAAD